MNYNNLYKQSIPSTEKSQKYVDHFSKKIKAYVITYSYTDKRMAKIVKD